MIIGILTLLMKPAVEVAALFFKTQTDKEKLRENSKQIAINADASIRAVKWGHWMGRVPLFMLEITHVTYASMIMIDSMWPSDYINPLKIPEWYMPYFGAVMISVTGLSTWLYRRN